MDVPDETIGRVALHSRASWRGVAIVVLAALFGAGLYGLGHAQGSRRTTSVEEPVARVAERLAPSVVGIEHAEGQGSGVVYDDGLILTAGHVVRGARQVAVRTRDEEVIGEVLGVDPETDIGVVRVDVDLPVAELGSSDDLQVGQKAIAIGSPYGLDESVTLGIISALEREVHSEEGTFDGAIQTDAPINPGNSGGPLADANGRVIGINHAIATQSGGNEGLGFAIPIDAVLESAGKILKGQVEDDLSPDPGLGFDDQPDDGFPPGWWEGEGGLEELHPGDGCFPRRPFPHLFDRLPRLGGPEVPAPRFVPDGYQLSSIKTTSRSVGDDSELLHEIELTSPESRIVISLGALPALRSRADTLRGDPRSNTESVRSQPAAHLITGGRSYLVFSDDDAVTGIIDAPDDIDASTLVRIAESLQPRKGRDPAEPARSSSSTGPGSAGAGTPTK